MENEDFTVEWTETKDPQYITDVRITKGGAVYRLPWYRRLLMRLLGRSHWHRVKITRR